MTFSCSLGALPLSVHLTCRDKLLQFSSPTPTLYSPLKTLIPIGNKNEKEKGDCRGAAGGGNSPEAQERGGLEEGTSDRMPVSSSQAGNREETSKEI